MNLFTAFAEILHGIITAPTEMTYENLMETKERLEDFVPAAKGQLDDTSDLSDVYKAAIVKNYGYLDRYAVKAGLSIKKQAQWGNRELVARAEALLATLYFILNERGKARIHAEGALALDLNNTEAAKLLQQLRG